MAAINQEIFWNILPMRRTLTLAVFLIALMVTYVVVWTDLSQEMHGWAAYKRGDYATALKQWQPLAKNGNARAQYDLGLMYFEGQGVAEDDREALKWWRLAAEQSYAPAQLKLSLMYAEGLGVAQDYQEEVKWTRLAAEQGLPQAQFILGLNYTMGRGVPQDYVKGYMWLDIAASRKVFVEEKLVQEAAFHRDQHARLMTPAQIEKAQEMARKCRATFFKQCDSVETEPGKPPPRIPPMIEIKLATELHNVDKEFMEKTKMYRDYVRELDEKGFDKQQLISYGDYNTELYFNNNVLLKSITKNSKTGLAQTQYLKEDSIYVTYTDFDGNGTNDVAQYMKDGKPKYHHILTQFKDTGEAWY